MGDKKMLATRSITRSMTCLSILLSLAGAANAQMPGEGKTVQPITTGQIGHIFQHAIVQIGLEKLGYGVKPHLEAEYPALHLTIAQGSADYTATHWDTLHASFYEQSGGDAVLERVGTLIAGAGQGYFIDKATADKHKISNIEQFKQPEIAKLFDSNGDGKANLTGCNPGWGCELVIEHQLDAFGLRDAITHDQGSYFALIADTITRYEAGSPILFYTWAPQWVGSVLKPGKDVVQLNVPFSSLPGDRSGIDTAQPDGSNPGFEVNNIVILANKEFLAANPAAKRLFELMKIPLEDVNQAILEQHEGADSPEQILAQAQEWVADNQAEFDRWVAEAAKVQ